MSEKINKANEIVKEYCSNNFAKKSYPYIDFVNEDRFLDEIIKEENVDLKKDSAEELAEFAIEQIARHQNLSRLLGF